MASRLEQDKQWLKQKLDEHQGKDWLTWEAVRKYCDRAKQLNNTGQQSSGERRELCQQIMQEYGITELEAVNIINGYGAADYIRKYERIKNQTALKIDENKQKNIEEEELSE